MTEQTDTIAAIATPPGLGGIGIIRVSGPASTSIAMQICGISPRPRQVNVCSFKNEDGSIIDTGIMLYFSGPASYTGEDVIELQGHGGSVVMSMLLKRVIACGARQAYPGEFTERALLNEKLDINQAEAVAELISSKSEQAARNALSTLQGVFSELIAELLQQLIDVRVYVESLLDFPEEDIASYIDGELTQRIQLCDNAIGKLLAQSKHGRLYAQGLQIAIIGRPNSGKSTLLNQLSGVDRAIVTAQPGTTRDTLQEDILIHDVPFRLIDTAGIRAAADSIESEGINRAVNSAKQADIILHVVDLSIADEGDELKELIKSCESAQVIRIFNKIDLLAKSPAVTEHDVYISAQNGDGVDLLKHLLISLVSESPDNDTCFIAQQRHVAVLQSLQRQLRSGWQQFTETQALELLAQDLLKMQEELSKITGNYVADDLLGEIFSRFCIGK